MYAAKGGGGGAASTTSGATASNGSDGGTSYIYVYNSANQLKWGYKVLGGYGGKAATGSNYGAGAVQRAQNTCQITENGTTWTTVNCSGYGQGGGNGGKVTDGTSTANGGSGGGSQYNAASYGGGGSGGGSSHEAGYEGSRYSSGGGGGTVRIVASGTTINKYYGKGGTGANGVAKITYDLVYQAAAGGGGGGGAFAKVTDVAVEPQQRYTVRVGGGGAGGPVSNNGTNGGTSSVTFGSATYTLSGGALGGLGTAATASALVTHGAGGAYGRVTAPADKTKLDDYKDGKAGTAGTSRTMTTSGVMFNISSGGRGGESGLGIKGGCGGLFIDSAICTNTDVNGTSVTFVAPRDVFESAEYGSAGAGGAGGGWSENTTSYPQPGGGSAGQSGYVYIYWTKFE